MADLRMTARKSNPFLQTYCLGPVDDALAHFTYAHHFSLEEHEQLGVAYSGGADSTALLIACAKHWPNQVVALHIHHGLQDAAQTFLEHCEKECQRLDIPLYYQKVNAHPQPGESPEDAARKSRYKALVQMGADQNLKAIALAQHADDQVETLLLALSRGAGLPGLASMPSSFVRDDQNFIRPLLGVSGIELRELLQQQNLLWIEDPTNQQAIYTRNRIRLQLLPALEKVFPEFRKTFARSSKHAAQAQELLDELGQQDLQFVGVMPDISALQKLSANRQSNVLRYWLRHHCKTMASARQLAELLKQIDTCRTRGHRIELKVGQGVVKRTNHYLTYQAKS